MSFTVRLIPKLGDPREVLQPGLTERRELVLDSNNDGGGIIVGRGTLTGICDSDVDEEAFRLTFNEHCYTQHLVLVSNMAPETSNLYVNGLPWDEYQEHIYLGHGEVISLDGLRYEYKVHIETTYSNDLGKKRKADSEDVISVLSNSPEPKETLDSLAASKCDHAPSSAGTVIAEESASRISEEIQCSVCLDIQVHSRTCSPCGHSFCASCVAKLDQCPQCRKEIVSHVPAVQLDGLIAALIHVPNLLEKDDVEHYKERVAAAQQSPMSKTIRAARKLPRTARSVASIPAYDFLSSSTRAFDTSMAPPFRQHQAVFFSPPSHSRRSRRMLAVAPPASSHQPQTDPLGAALTGQESNRVGRPGATSQDAICID